MPSFDDFGLLRPILHALAGDTADISRAVDVLGEYLKRSKIPAASACRSKATAASLVIGRNAAAVVGDLDGELIGDGDFDGQQGGAGVPDGVADGFHDDGFNVLGDLGPDGTEHDLPALTR